VDEGMKNPNAGRKPGKYVKEGDKLVKVTVVITQEQLDQLNYLGTKNMSELVRGLLEGYLKTPLDIEKEATLKQIRALQAELATLNKHLEEITVQEEIEADLNLAKQKEAPVVNLILNRFRKIINPEVLGGQLAHHIWALGLLKRADEVKDLRSEWVKFLFPYVRKVILDEAKFALDGAGFIWPKSLSEDEALRYALVDVCGYPDSVLTPLTDEEKLEIIKNSAYHIFPKIGSGEERKQVISHLGELAKAYSLDYPARQLLAMFYGDKEPEPKE
jgi:hypothetical protein